MATMDEIYTRFKECRGVSTDTRSIGQDCLFFALKGPNFNGNKFAAEALEKGAKYVIVDEAKETDDRRFMVVDNVLKTLQQLGNFHRNKFNLPVLAITGSNGKTTTKELMYKVLSGSYQTLATQGNLNNYIGVPLTLLRIDNNTEIAIVEMGANQLGDIKELCALAQPTHGLITNIGKAHTQGFGNLEGVIRGKSELFQYLRAQGGAVFINTDDEVLKNMSKRFEKPYTYPGPQDYYSCKLISADPYVELETETGDRIKTRLAGAYNFENLAAALCIGKYFKVPAQAAHQAVSGYVPQDNRSQILYKGSNTIILDAYNANPSSMRVALNNLVQVRAEHRVAILGDMYELGDTSEEEHYQLGLQLTQSGLQHIWLCGELIRPTVKSCPEAQYFSDKQDLIAHLQKNPIEHSIILVKASRAIGLEDVVDYI